MAFILRNTIMTKLKRNEYHIINMSDIYNINTLRILLNHAFQVALSLSVPTMLKLPNHYIHWVIPIEPFEVK